MPISGPSSYSPTIAEFVAHWGTVNTALGSGGPLRVLDGVTLAALEAESAALDEDIDAVTDAGVERALERASQLAMIEALQGRVVEFNRWMRAYIPTHALTRILPDAFEARDAEGTVRDVCRQISNIWAKVNILSPLPPGVTLPVTLLGGYGVGTFDTARGDLRASYAALSAREVELNEKRELRNDRQDVIYAILKAYRLVVPTKFAAGHALVESMPALTPGEGHTPEPVAANAVWDVPGTKAKVTWEASEDADLAHYQVRGVAGEDYQASDEVLLATVGPGDPREVLTAFALTNPGVTAGFKVYVVLTTGREKGSLPVFVTRPV